MTAPTKRQLQHNLEKIRQMLRTYDNMMIGVGAGWDKLLSPEWCGQALMAVEAMVGHVDAVEEVFNRAIDIADDQM